MNNQELTYAEIVQAVDSIYYANGLDSGTCPGMGQYGRWKNYWATRIDASTGRLPIMAKNIVNHYNNISCSTTQMNGVNFDGWRELGPKGLSFQVNGCITSLSVNPENPNEIYAGAWGGGLWYTNNRGANWINLLDNTPYSGLGVRAICVDYRNAPDQNRVYIVLSVTMKKYDNYGLIYSVSNGSVGSWVNLTIPAPVNFDDAYISKIKLSENKQQLLFLSTYYVHRCFVATNGALSVPSLILDKQALYPNNSSELQSMEFIPGQQFAVAVSSGFHVDSWPPIEPYSQFLVCSNLQSATPTWTDQTNKVAASDDIITNPTMISTVQWDFNAPALSPSGYWDATALNLKLNVYNTATNAPPQNTLSDYSKAFQIFTVGGFARSMRFSGSALVTIPANSRIRIYTGWVPTDLLGTNTPLYDSDLDPTITNHAVNFTGTISFTDQSTNYHYSSCLIFQASPSGGGTLPVAGAQLEIDEVHLYPLRHTKLLLTADANELNKLFVYARSAQTYTGEISYVTTPTLGFTNASYFLQERLTAPFNVNNDWKFDFKRSKEDPNLFLFGGLQLYGTYTTGLGMRYSNLYQVPPTIANPAKHDDVTAIEVCHPTGSLYEYIVVANDGGVSMWERDIHANITSPTYSAPLVKINGNINASTLHGIGTSLQTGGIISGAHDQGIFMYFPQKEGKWSQKDAGDGYSAGFSKTFPNQSWCFTTGGLNARFTSTPTNFFGAGLGIANWNESITISTPPSGIVTVGHRKPRDNQFYSYLLLPNCMTNFSGDYFGGHNDYAGKRSEIIRRRLNTPPTSTLPHKWQNMTRPGTFPPTSSIWGTLTAAGAFESTNKVTAVEVHDVFSNIMYAGLGEHKLMANNYLLRSNNSGTTWLDLSSYLPSLATVSSHINCIETDPQNYFRVWVGMSYYKWNNPNVDRVYTSPNQGLSWIDISNGLPGVPINDLEYDNKSQILFAATDIGVFFYDTKLTTPIWTCLDKNLPHVPVTALDFNYCTGKIVASTFGRGVWECDMPYDFGLAGSSPVATIEINGVVTWNQSRNVSQSILVKSGSKLVIERDPLDPSTPVTINMGKMQIITVEQGAALIVDNATITNECATMWGGIAVLGTANMPHTGIPIPTNVATGISPTSLLTTATWQHHGIVWLKNNATLSNAQIAICTGSFWYSIGSTYPNEAGDGGGLVFAQNAIFKNNRKSIGYRLFNKRYLGFVEHSQFIADAFLSEGYYLDVAGNKMGQPEFITAWGIDGLLIQQNEFSQLHSADYPAYGNYGIAIFGIDAGMNINNNIFNNLRAGMKLFYTPTSFLFSFINDNQMTNVLEGIYINGYRFKNPILRNYIDISFIPGSTPTPQFSIPTSSYGIYADHCNVINIQENTIIYDPNSLPAPYTGWNNTWGIVLHSTDKGYNRVRSNIIHEIHHGVTAIGRNDELQINCNQFSNSITSAGNKSMNIWVSDAPSGIIGTVQNPQGSCNLGASNPIQFPAGNKFSICGSSTYLLKRFVKPNFGFGKLKYLQHANDPYTINSCYTSSATLLPENCHDALNCDNHLACCPPEFFQMDACILNPGLCEQAIYMYNTQITQKEGILDGGNSAYLFDLIDNPNNAPAYIMQELLAIGNYLSDDVLRALIEKNILSNYQLKTVMIANSPLSQFVYDYLALVSPIVAFNYSVWYAQQQGLSDRDILETEINALKDLQSKKVIAMVYAYQLLQQYDSAANLLYTNKYYEEAFSFYLKANNEIGAQLAITQISDSSVATLFGKCLTMYRDGINISTLNNQDSLYYSTLKNNYTSAGRYANTMLMLKGNDYQPYFPNSDSIVEYQSRTKQPIIDFTEILPDEQYSIYPNPTTGILNILKNTGTFSLRTKLQLFDITGKLVFTNLLGGNTYLHSMQLPSSLESGFYMVKLIESETDVFITKITLQN
jgi:hypothetical protein